MTGNSSGKRELEKELPKPCLILADVGINLAVGAFKVSVTDHSRPPMPGTGNVNHVEVIFFDDPVQMRVNKILAGCCAPVTEQHVFHIRERQRPLQQWIVVKIDLAHRKVVGSSPV